MLINSVAGIPASQRLNPTSQARMSNGFRIPNAAERYLTRFKFNGKIKKNN